MTVPGAIRPHGGRLVDRHTDKDCSGMKTVQVSAELASDMENIADGIFSPLEGFVGSGDLEGIISKGRLEDGTAWTIPIMLDADAASARSIKDAGEVLLEGPGGQGRAILHAEEEFAFDAAAAARGVFGTDDPKHPGVSKMLSLKERLVSGKIDQVSAPSESELRRHRMTPSQTRQAFSDAGWKSIAAFQTRNPPHVAHEMLQKAALTVRDGVFVNPLVGRKKPGDFADEVIINCYTEMIKKYYPEGRCKMATLHTEMRYAGPKEAIHHAIMRQNYGCTGIIIGRDHAGVGSYYDPFAAHKIFDDYEDLEIEPIFFPAFFYCNDCLAFTNAKGCPHDEASREQISGTKMREMIQAGQSPSKFILRPEVSQIILDHPSPFVK